MRTTYVIVAMLAAHAAFTAQSQAGVWSKAMREALEAVGKRSGKAVDDAAGIASRSTAKTVRGTARSGALIVRGSDDVAGAIAGQFGDEGARAMSALSPVGAQRLAAMSDELAGGGRGADWMRLIAKRGDEVTDWLWKRRGGVAVGATATAVVLAPEEFLRASGQVATTTINTGGRYVAGPIIERAAAAIPWVALWVVLFIGGVLWLAAKRRDARAGPLTRRGPGVSAHSA